MTVVVALVLLGLLIAIRTPIGLALGMAGTVGILLLDGAGSASSTLAGSPAANLVQHGLIIVPLFILMGYLLMHAGLAADLFDVASKVVGRRVPGGLAIAAVLARAAFAGVTGSSAATVASIGRISYLEMRRHGYRDSFAAGIVAMAGTLGVMIPPSAFLVVYAIIAEVSVQAMLLAGIIPGLLSALVYSTLIVIRVTRPGQTLITDPGPAGSGATAGSLGAVGRARGSASLVAPSVGSSSRVLRAVSLSAVAILFFVVIGGMYLGFFTATEAGAVGASAALVLTLLICALRREKPWLAVGRALVESVSSTSMIALLLAGSGIFSYFLVLAGVPRTISQIALNAEVPGWLVVIGILVILLILGAVLEGMSLLLIVTPLALPILLELGFDPIWFGILLVKSIEIGLVTPPLGINVYVLAGGVRDLKAERGFAGVAPFWLAEIVSMAIVFIFPSIVLFLPQTAAG